MMRKMVSKFVFLLILIVLCKSYFAKNFKLKQVFILSRHNMRYAIGTQLHRYSPKPWPSQGGPRGLLSPKGAQLEGYMGEYFSEWFEKEEFLPEGCPGEDTVYVYANTKSRTKATARAFVDTAFKTCNVTVHHKNITNADPLFDVAIRNVTEAYKDMAIKEINRKLQNNPKLKAVYSELNKILYIEESDVCKQDGICDLTEANDTVLAQGSQSNKFVEIDGPFKIAYLAVDAFISNYYNGMPIEDIAWGQITTPEKWNLLTEIARQNMDIRYTTVAGNVATPLMEYLTNTFKNYDKKPKLMLFVGHDNNINAIVTFMGFKSIDLPNQYETIPIGGKLVFQRWTDGENDFLKVEFVYPSWSQLRAGSKYTLETPPQRVVMRLNWCNTDEQGFCPWQEFVNKLKVSSPI